MLVCRSCQSLVKMIHQILRTGMGPSVQRQLTMARSALTLTRAPPRWPTRVFTTTMPRAITPGQRHPRARPFGAIRWNRWRRSKGGPTTCSYCVGAMGLVSTLLIW